MWNLCNLWLANTRTVCRSHIHIIIISVESLGQLWWHHRVSSSIHLAPKPPKPLCDFKCVLMELTTKVDRYTLLTSNYANAPPRTFDSITKRHCFSTNNVDDDILIKNTHSLCVNIHTYKYIQIYGAYIFCPCVNIKTPPKWLGSDFYKIFCVC